MGGALDALVGLGNLEHRLGNGAAAALAFERALAEYDAADSVPTQEAVVYEAGVARSLDVRASLALVGWSLTEGKPDGAGRARLDSARELVPEGTSPALDAAYLLAVGQMEAIMGDNAGALESFALAERMFSNANLVQSAGLAQLARGRVNARWGDLASAQMAYEDALASFLAVRDRIGQAEARWGLAGTLAAAGQYMESNVQFRIAAQLFSRFGLAERAVRNRRCLAGTTGPGTGC